MKRIVITGSTTGIGKLLKENLESQGHTVLGLARTSKEFACDVTNYEQVEAWSTYFLDAFDGIDALITCAGTQGELGSIHKTDPLKWADTINVNLIGTYNCIRAFYPIMDCTRPKIICMAGGGSAYGRPYFSAYAAAKTAVVRLVESVAGEYTTLDINAVAPGAIKTDIIKSALEAGPEIIGKDEYEKAKKQSEGGDSPEHLISLVNWLLSETSNGISGKFISAKWDDWKSYKKENTNKDALTLRRQLF